MLRSNEVGRPPPSAQGHELDAVIAYYETYLRACRIAEGVSSASVAGALAETSRALTSY